MRQGPRVVPQSPARRCSTGRHDRRLQVLHPQRHATGPGQPTTPGNKQDARGPSADKSLNSHRSRHTSRRGAAHEPIGGRPPVLGDANGWTADRCGTRPGRGFHPLPRRATQVTALTRNGRHGTPSTPGRGGGGSDAGPCGAQHADSGQQNNGNGIGPHHVRMLTVRPHLPAGPGVGRLVRDRYPVRLVRDQSVAVAAHVRRHEAPAIRVWQTQPHRGTNRTPVAPGRGMSSVWRQSACRLRYPGRFATVHSADSDGVSAAAGALTGRPSALGSRRTRTAGTRPSSATALHRA